MNLPNFNSCCEAACIKLWGEPDKRSNKELRWNGADASTGRRASPSASGCETYPALR